MQFSDALRAFWPLFAAVPLFLILGFWWRFQAAAAMEQSPKPYTWVRQYRTGGFPFRRKLMGSPKLRVWALLAVLAAAGALWAGRFFSLDASGSGRPEGLALILPSALCLLGAGAVFCLLSLLFDRLWVSLPASLLYAAASLRSNGAEALLTVSLLLLLLYLRTDRPGVAAELLYLAAVLALAPAVALRPAFLWLLPCYPPVHWYKLPYQPHGKQLSGRKLLLFLALSLIAWAVAVVLAAMLHPFLAQGGYVPWFTPSEIVYALRELAQEALDGLSLPTVEAAADLGVDAPLLGYGLWGCCSAWVLARRRRNIRGTSVLAVLAASVLLWLLTWRWVPILGLTLTTACILRDADLGGKRLTSVLFPLAGFLWYCFIYFAAWAVPLAGALLDRLK